MQIPVWKQLTLVRMFSGMWVIDFIVVCVLSRVDCLWITGVKQEKFNLTAIVLVLFM